MPEAPAQDSFVRTPIEVIDGIPVFCARDRYVQNYEKIASDHIEAMRPGSDNPFIADELWRLLDASTRNLLVKHMPRGSSILDIGVGLGRVLAELPQFERHGVDISMDYLRKARQAGIAVAQARVEDLPYADGSFDAVMACDVLEHVLDLNRSCAEMIRVLKPGGTLVIRVPFKECLDVYLRDDLPYEFIHLRSFDEAGLRLLFGKVFNLQFVEACEVAPYLQGSPRLRLRLLPAEALEALKRVTRTRWWLFRRVRPALAVSERQLERWMYSLQAKHPDVFRQVAHHLLMGIEINAVFRKPR